ncbi:Uncharacterised protein [Bordetella pertussis]|nr:Uncharacterised protein [Bordetella pertussis]
MFGGASRNRTDVHGFAIRCITTLPLRRQATRKKEARQVTASFPFWCLERETSLELATSTLARLRSTN